MKLLGLLAMTTACGAPVATKPLASPLDSLAFYVGNWDCKGTEFATKDTPEKHWTAKVVVAPELDTWLSVKMIGPDDNRTVEHKGYDPATKTWHHLGVSNGGGWGTMTSKGWDGQRMVFAPDNPADHSVTTFTRLGEREYSHGVSEGNVKIWEKVCSKTSRG